MSLTPCTMSVTICTQCTGIFLLIPVFTCVTFISVLPGLFPLNNPVSDISTISSFSDSYFKSLFSWSIPYTLNVPPSDVTDISSCFSSPAVIWMLSSICQSVTPISVYTVAVAVPPFPICPLDAKPDTHTVPFDVIIAVLFVFPHDDDTFITSSIWLVLSLLYSCFITFTSVLLFCDNW